MVCDTRIADAGLLHIAALSNLEMLHLAGTQVTADGIARLEKELPGLSVYRD